MTGVCWVENQTRTGKIGAGPGGGCDGPPSSAAERLGASLHEVSQTRRITADADGQKSDHPQ